MTLREVKPLNSEQWKIVEKALKEGPTPEHDQLLEKALERAKQMKEIK